jgi:hypothetical protein
MKGFRLQATLWEGLLFPISLTNGFHCLLYLVVLKSIKRGRIFLQEYKLFVLGQHFQQEHTSSSACLFLVFSGGLVSYFRSVSPVRTVGNNPNGWGV